MTHQVVTCMMYARGRRNLTVSLDWSSHFGDAIGAAMAKSNQYQVAMNRRMVVEPGLNCEASIDSSLWRHDPRPWEAIVPIVTNGIRRMKRGKRGA